MHRAFRSLMITLSLVLLITAVATADDGKLTQRSDISDKYKWDLTDIFADQAAWDADFEKFKNGIELFAKYQGTLNDPNMLLECMLVKDSVELIGDNLYVYAYLKLDEDNRVSAHQEQAGKIAALYSKFSQATSFIEPEILSIDNDKLRSMLNANPELDQYRFYLEDLIRQKEHILSAEKEELLAQAGQMAGTASNVFNMINDADISYGEVYDEDSNLVQLSKQRYYAFLESEDRRVRRDANQAYNEAYLNYVNSLAATLSGSVKKDYFYSQARGYETCLDMALDSDNIPDDVFHNLIDAVNANLEPLHKWASIRKRLLGVDTLYTYDMWVPVLPDMKREFEYEEAKEMVLEGLEPMGNRYLTDFEKGLTSGWIDVFESEGKGSGAYQWGTYSIHPYVLLNYNQQLGDIFTLAHEMGHAMHSYYTNKNEPYRSSGHSLFVAEVASTLNEALLLNYLVERADDDRKKLYLLNRQLDNTMGTFFHQVMYAHFEMMIHEEIEKGGALSAELMNQWWADLTKKYYGPVLTMDDMTPYKWSRIPHFYMTYYVFQYATSYAASQAIFDKFMAGESGIIDKYLNLLKAGGSDYPIELLKGCGVDMAKPDAVKATIDRFAQQVDQVEQLAGV